jgi:hypothetical protein
MIELLHYRERHCERLFREKPRGRSITKPFTTKGTKVHEGKSTKAKAFVLLVCFVVKVF